MHTLCFRGGGPQGRAKRPVKYIIAIIKPQRLEVVREALAKISVDGMTVTEVRGYGRQRGHVEVYRGVEYDVQFMPKVKIEIAVDDDKAEATVAAIRDTAATGRIGDGKVFVFDLGEAMRIRTGETGPEAL